MFELLISAHTANVCLVHSGKEKQQLCLRRGGNIFQFLNQHNFHSDAASSALKARTVRVNYSKHELSPASQAARDFSSFSPSPSLPSFLPSLFLFPSFNPLYKNTHCLQGLELESRYLE